MTDTQAPRRSPVLLFAAFSLITMAVVAGLFSAGALLEIAKLSQVRNWPTVDGTITVSAVTPGCRGNDAYTPVVEYRYAVNGVSYEGKRRNLDMALCDTQARAGQVTLRYPVGSHVVVYVDPARPAQAVLETAVDKGALWFMAVATLVVSATGLYWVLPRVRILLRGGGSTPA